MLATGRVAGRCHTVGVRGAARRTAKRSRAATAAAEAEREEAPGPAECSLQRWRDVCASH